MGFDWEEYYGLNERRLYDEDITLADLIDEDCERAQEITDSLSETTWYEEYFRSFGEFKKTIYVPVKNFGKVEININGHIGGYYSHVFGNGFYLNPFILVSVELNKKMLKYVNTKKHHTHILFAKSFNFEDDVETVNFSDKDFSANGKEIIFDFSESNMQKINKAIQYIKDCIMSMFNNVIHNRFEALKNGAKINVIKDLHLCTYFCKSTIDEFILTYNRDLICIVHSSTELPGFNYDAAPDYYRSMQIELKDAYAVWWTKEDRKNDEDSDGTSLTDWILNYDPDSHKHIGRGFIPLCPKTIKNSYYYCKRPKTTTEKPETVIVLDRYKEESFEDAIEIPF